MRTASSRESAPLATSALYSPSECPAALTGAGSVETRAEGGKEGNAGRHDGRLRIARQGELVLGTLETEGADFLAERLVGALEHFARGAKASATSRPIPTNCEPCPGKHHAIRIVTS